MMHVFSVRDLVADRYGQPIFLGNRNSISTILRTSIVMRSIKVFPILP